MAYAMISRREWEQLYYLWKEAHPEMMGDEQKVVRGRIVRGCVRKFGFDTYDEAMEVVAKLPIRPFKVLHAYACQICPKFHIGNTRAPAQTFKLRSQPMPDAAHVCEYHPLTGDTEKRCFVCQGLM